MKDESAPVKVAGIRQLSPHPRLYLKGNHMRRAVNSVQSNAPRGLSNVRGGLSNVRAEISARAREYAATPHFDELLPVHNAHLIRARKMQARVVTLIAEWKVSNNPRYADTAFAHLQAIGGWEYWSWIALRRGDPRPDALFDLSYGENSATLALGYDMLYEYLSGDQRSELVDIAADRALRPLLDVHERGELWWLKKPDSNWNTACAGGAGMLGLAMYEETAEGRAAVELAEQCITPYMASLEESDGGWPEGIGYWNYGMRYAFMYLLSSENATGRPHPLLHTAGAHKTLWFPLDFCPHGMPCSFGDSNDWAPLPFHYAAAERLDEISLLHELDTVAQKTGRRAEDVHWPVAAELRLLDLEHSAGAGERSESPDPSIRVYEGLGWARLSDRWPDPNLYLSIRGGTIDVPHGHQDLLSFNTVVGDERLIENLTPLEYLDTTFGPRRFEMFEMAAHSKNAPIVDGVGLTAAAHVRPAIETYGNHRAIRLDATAAVGGGRESEPLARFCGRLFMLFGSRAALVVDRISMWHEGRVESRLHTRADVRAKSDDEVILVGDRQQMSILFAANASFGLTVSTTLPTTPGDEATVLRWSGPSELRSSFWMAALLIPGDAAGRAWFEETRAGMTVHVTAGGWSERVLLTDDIMPQRHDSAKG